MNNDLILAENKQSYCWIAATAKADRTLRFAAGELASYFSRICGTRIKAGQKPGYCNIRISLAVSDELRSKSRFEGQDRFAIDVSDNGIRILGENSRSVLFAVYSFLEELGCRWYYPDKKHQVVPRLNKVTAKKGFREISHRLAIRNMSLLPMIGRDLNIILDFVDWIAKNHYNSLITNPADYGNASDFWCTDLFRWSQVEDKVIPALKKRGLKLFMSGHNMHFFLPPEKLYHKHPDWFAVRPLTPPGKGYPKNRLAAQLTRFFEDPTDSKHHYEIPGSTKCWPGWLNEDGRLEVPHQMCFSNPHAVKEYTKRILAYVKDNPQIDSLGPWPSDGNSFCKCPKCKTDPYVIFRTINNIAKEIRKIAPKLKVEHLVYGEATFKIPTKFHDVSDNLIFCICGPAAVRKRWGRWLDNIGLLSYRGDYVLADNYAQHGMVMFRPDHAYNLVEETLQSSVHGVSNFFIETTSWWRSCLNVYFLAKASLSKPPKMHNLIKDYCEKYYGKYSKQGLKLHRTAGDGSDMPLDLSGHGNYSQKQLNRIEDVAGKLQALIAGYEKNANNDTRLANLLRYFTYVQKILAIIPLRAGARKSVNRMPRKTLIAMLEVARLEEELLGICHESKLAGDGVLDTRFFVSRRWERFDRDVELIKQAEKKLRKKQ